MTLGRIQANLNGGERPRKKTKHRLDWYQVTYNLNTATQRAHMIETLEDRLANMTVSITVRFQHGFVEYKVKRGNTCESIARFFQVPLSRVKNCGGKCIPGRILKFKANVFSHKRGWATGPLLVDAKGKAITDPRKSSRAYTGLSYKKYCSSFCVKNRGIKVGHTHPKVVKNTR